MEMPLVQRGTSVDRTPSVLIVEDNRQAVEIIDATLSDHGYATTVASSIREANRQIEARRFDLIILDLGLPDGSGLEFCTHIRSHGDIPVIIVSAAGTPEERIAGFDAGADDYIPKPLHPVELLRRVDAVLRRTGFETTKSVLVAPYGLELDLRTGVVCYQDRVTTLTRSEAALLRLLIEGLGTAQPTEELIRRVWDYEDIGESNFLHQHMSRLRKKLRDFGYPTETIRTVYGVGYAMVGPTPDDD